MSIPDGGKSRKALWMQTNIDLHVICLDFETKIVFKNIFIFVKKGYN